MDGTTEGDKQWSGVVKTRLGFCPGWGICGVRLGQSDVGAASGPPHIWTRYGLGIGEWLGGEFVTRQ